MSHDNTPRNPNDEISSPEVSPNPTPQRNNPIASPAQHVPSDSILARGIKQLLHISTGSGIGIVGILIAITLPVGQCLVENHQAEIGHKETNVKIAVGILGEKAQKDKEGNREEFSVGEKELRRWALRQLNRYTDQGDQIKGDAAEALVTGVSKISSYGGHYILDEGVGQTTNQKKAPKKTGSL